MGNLFSKRTQGPSSSNLGKREIETDKEAVKRQRCNDCTLHTEEDVGIVSFVNPSKRGFHGSIKKVHDFIVREIDLNGNVVAFTTTNPPKEHTKLNLIDAHTFDKEVCAFFGDEIMHKVRCFLGTDRNDASASLVFEADRDSRKKMYQLLEQHLGADKPLSLGEFGKVVLRWPQEDDVFEEVAYPDVNDCGDNYLQFVVHMEGISTLEAIAEIAKCSETQPKYLSCAELKDQSGIIVQRVTIHKSCAIQLLKAQKELEEKDIYVGDFRYVSKELAIGDLSGNQFTVVLSDIPEAEQSQLEKSIESVKQHGFINYFGVQYFGTSEIMTHEIGRAILKNNYEEAANLILQSRLGNEADVDAARHYWGNSHDSDVSVKILPLDALSATSILKSYAKYPNQHQKAINKIPPKALSLYIQAYQAYIWNRVISERVKRHGCSEPLVGDIVLVDIPAPSKSAKRGRNAKKVTSGERVTSKIPKILTRRDLKNYTIFDVVFPLPGYSTVYPTNEFGDLYKLYLEQDGVTFRKGVQGEYRTILAKPKHLEWSWIRYNDPMTQLISSEVDKVNYRQEPESIPDGKCTALRISFHLDTHQFATMALREIVRTQALSDNQATRLHT